MKIRAKTNGNILELSDEEAAAYLESGIYEKVEKSTKVEPLTTKDMPKQSKKVK